MDKAPKRKVVKRPKGTAARIEKEVAAKLKRKIVKRPKIDYDKVEDNNVYLGGNEFIYNFEDFMTPSELNARSEAAQLKAMERASARLSKAINKRLKEIAKEQKIKTTEQLIKYLKTIKSATAMRKLMDL